MKSFDDEPLLRRLRASDPAACLGMLVQVCRACPSFWAWLCHDFVRDPFVRERVAELVKDKDAVPPSHYVELTKSGDAWREERKQLLSLSVAKPYGGLTEKEVETRIRRFQAGRIKLGIFLLVRRWHEAGSASPATMWAGLHFLDALLPSRDWDLHTELRYAFTFLRQFGRDQKRQAAFSRADWWKTQLLWYVLGHPREAYRTGELRGHLATLGVEVSPKEIRRFCKRCGLRRDERAGRPRTAHKLDRRRREFRSAALPPAKAKKPATARKKSNAGA